MASQLGPKSWAACARFMAQPAAKVYEVWVKHGGAAPVPAATTFVVRSGEIPIAHSVDRGDQVLVTAEPKGGSLTPTSPPMIVARPA